MRWYEFIGCSQVLSDDLEYTSWPEYTASWLAEQFE
jgi:hypothetical protein